MFCIVVDWHQNLVEAKLVGEMSIVVRVPIGVYTGLDHGDHVNILRWCNRLQEYIGTIARCEEYDLLSLQPKTQKVTLTEFQKW
jgi:hypothetical protein